MSSTRNVSRTTTTNSKIHHTNGSSNSYETNDSSTNINYSTGNNSEYDSNLSRSSLIRNVSQYDGIYRNARFIHAISSGLVGQQVVIQTSDHEQFHGVLETFSPNADIVLTVSHRLDNNNNDMINSTTTLPIDFVNSIDSSTQTFELHKRIIKASNIVEIIAVDVDLSNNVKCSLEENSKISQLEDDRFSRMQHFYGSDEIDPETLEDLELGADGKAGFDAEDMFHTNRQKFNTTTDFHESKYTNVPVRQMSDTELAEIEKKVQEIERGTRSNEIDEDDAGVKRPSESHNFDDRNSNTKGNRTNRNDFLYDGEYNSSKQRSIGNNNNNRRGGNNSKPNRQQHNTRLQRNERFTDRSSQEGRDSSLQTTNEDATRSQRLNNENISQEQSSDSTSPTTTTISTRTIYPSTNRSTNNQNSPTPYTGSSSSRNNSISTTSPSSGTNKLTQKSALNEQQTSSATDNVTSPLTVSTHDDTHQSNTSGKTTPNSTKGNGGLNPEAIEFVPVFSRESSSRPESRGTSTASTTSMNTFIPHPHPVHILQQQQQQQQQTLSQTTPPIISATHPQNAALYQQYYQTAFANMPQFINATPQQMTVGVMSTPMIPSQSLVGTGQNTNNSNTGSSSGMTTPNSSVSAGPTYKINNNNNNNTNQNNSGDNGNTTVNSIPPKKAVVSVQRPEQSNVYQQQQQQIPGAPPVIFPAQPIRYYSPEYISQQGTPTSMHLQPIPFYYPVNTSGLIQAAATIGQPQNFMIPTANTTAGTVASGITPLHYTGVYTDPRMCNLYSTATVSPANVNQNWQLGRSPPQQQTDQQRAYGNGQNVSSQQTPSNGASNTSGRTSSTSSQTSVNNNTIPTILPQYTLNGIVPTAWISGPQQVQSAQGNIPSQINAGYNFMFDLSQSVPPQQATYIHPNLYETPAYFPPQSQQQQQQQPTPPQQGLDTVPQSNYNR